jgi:hypothetical protein
MYIACLLRMSLLILLLYVVFLSLFCHCLHLFCLTLLHPLLLSGLFNLWLIVVLAFNRIYRLVLLVFCVQMFCSIDYLFFVCRCSSEQASFSSSPHLYVQPIYVSFWVMCLVQLVTFCLPMSISCISSYPQLIIPQLYLKIGTANVPLTAVLFFTFDSNFSIVLFLFVYSFLNFLSFFVICNSTNESTIIINI